MRHGAADVQTMPSRHVVQTGTGNGKDEREAESDRPPPVLKKRESAGEKSDLKDQCAGALVSVVERKSDAVEQTPRATIPGLGVPCCLRGDVERRGQSGPASSNIESEEASVLGLEGGREMEQVQVLHGPNSRGRSCGGSPQMSAKMPGMHREL